jgi:RNA polymerase-binding transcription factor DksA
MTAAERTSYRRVLTDLKERLTGDVTQLRAEGRAAGAGEAGAGEWDVPPQSAELGGHESTDEDLTLGLLQNEEQLLAEIEAALGRLDQGTFGQCEACGKPIAKMRLHALPYARQCTPCACQTQGEPTD